MIERIKEILTPTEYDIFLLLAQGLTTQDIADMRKTSRGTVHAQKYSVMAKLGATKITQVVHLGILSGAIEPLIPQGMQDILDFQKENR